MSEPMQARRYYRRSGILMIVAAAVLALAVGIAGIPDLLGLAIGIALVAILVGGGVYRLRKARALSPSAVVHESMRAGHVHVEVDEPLARRER